MGGGVVARSWAREGGAEARRWPGVEATGVCCGHFSFFSAGPTMPRAMSASRRRVLPEPVGPTISPTWKLSCAISSTTAARAASVLTGLITCGFRVQSLLEPRRQANRLG